MNALVPSRGSWLTRPRVVGTPLHWARNTALLGGLAGGWAPLSWLLYEEVVHSIYMFSSALLFVLPSLLAGMLVGGALGLVQPALLDRVRGRMRLPVLALAQAGVGAVAGAAVGLAWLLSFISIYGPPTGSGLPTLGEMTALIAGMGAGVGGLTTLIWWLPFTVATVLKARTWPVTAAAIASSPLWLFLAWYALAMLLF